MFKRALLGVSALALLAGTASAADLANRYPVKAAVVPVQVFSWTGFYIGGNVGWGWANNSLSYTTLGLGTFDYNVGNTNGFLGGLQAGFNYQLANNVVLGLEADYQWTDLGSDTLLIGGPLGAGAVSQNVDSFGTIRARLGYAMDRFLPYITGGAAYAKLNYTDPFGLNFGNNKWGWTAGAGVEYAITNNFTVKGEYLYAGFSDTTQAYLNGDQISASTDIQTLRVGANYKF